MKLTEQLIVTAQAYCKATGKSPSRVSSLAFSGRGKPGDGTKLTAIMNGNADITTRRFESAMLWFSDNWPDGAEWPSSVARPSLSSVGAS